MNRKVYPIGSILRIEDRKYMNIGCRFHRKGQKLVLIYQLAPWPRGCSAPDEILEAEAENTELFREAGGTEASRSMVELETEIDRLTRTHSAQQVLSYMEEAARFMAEEVR